MCALSREPCPRANEQSSLHLSHLPQSPHECKTKQTLISIFLLLLIRYSFCQTPIRAFQHVPLTSLSHCIITISSPAGDAQLFREPKHPMGGAICRSSSKHLTNIIITIAPALIRPENSTPSFIPLHKYSLVTLKTPFSRFHFSLVPGHSVCVTYLLDRRNILATQAHFIGGKCVNIPITAYSIIDQRQRIVYKWRRTSGKKACITPRFRCRAHRALQQSTQSIRTNALYIGGRNGKSKANLAELPYKKQRVGIARHGHRESVHYPPNTSAWSGRYQVRVIRRDLCQEPRFAKGRVCGVAYAVCHAKR